MTMTTACDYVQKLGWPVFPVMLRRNRRTGKLDKKPLVEQWGDVATTETAQIEAWWRRWPQAAIGVPTGRRSRVIVLDIDVKRPEEYGWDTLEALAGGFAPETPMAHTTTGGTHIYFATISREIRNSEGENGLGPGLDIRGEGGFIVTPTPGSGYVWDPHCNPDTVPFMPAPAWLGHKERPERAKSGPIHRLRPETILDGACANIRSAGPGTRHSVINREGFSVGALVAAGALKESEARHALEAAVAALTWGTHGDIRKAERDLADAFNDGLATTPHWRRAG